MDLYFRIHAGDSPFECSSCGEMFWDVHLLREHTRLKHPGAGVKVEREDEEEEVTDRPYTGDERFGNFRCQTCGLEFHRQDLLKKHARYVIDAFDKSVYLVKFRTI